MHHFQYHLMKCVVLSLSWDANHLHVLVVKYSYLTW